MVNIKRLAEMIRKWRNVAAIGRRRISLPCANAVMYSRKCSIAIVEKGHFVVYTADGRRFMIPLTFLSSPIFNELLKIADDEFGLPGDGPITLPCDAVFMDYVVSLVCRRVSKDVEMALLTSIATGQCSMTSSLHRESNLMLPLHDF